MSSSSWQTVIIEIDAPHPRITAAQVEQSTSHLFSHKRQFRIVAPEADTNDLVAAVRKAFTDITGRTAGRYLPTSKTFIVDVTGKQLMQLAQLPTIRAIHPNGERR